MTRRRIGRVLAATALCVAPLSMASCTGNSIYNVNLPGGADLGSHPYKIKADFTDALDLVRQSAVKVNDVAVGQVDKISLIDDGKLAEVTVELNGNVHLPANAAASIQQSSLLGEKFVAITSPTQPSGTLAAGATIPVGATSQGIEIEQVFGALSLLLNGGGIGQLHDIVHELDQAVGGRTETIRALLQSADVVVGKVNAHRSDIIAALQAVSQLATTLKANRSSIDVALRDLPAGLAVLANQRHQLVRLLQSLDSLSGTTVSTVRASQQSIVSDLKSLAPILTQLSNAGTNLPDSLQILLTYPFPDSVLAAIKGDYLNAFITTDLNTPGGAVVHTTPRTGASRTTTAPPPPALLPATSSATPGLAESQLVTTATGRGGH